MLTLQLVRILSFGDGVENVVVGLKSCFHSSSFDMNPKPHSSFLLHSLPVFMPLSINSLDLHRIFVRLNA
jgi:hypothetical protein